MPTIPSSNSCKLRFSNGIMIRIKQRNNRYTYSYRQRRNTNRSWRRIAVKYSRICQGCQETQPNQMAHMYPGGCLSDEYGKFLI